MFQTLKTIGFTSALVATSLYAGPKFNFNDGKSSLEIGTIMQWWGAVTPDPQNVPETDSRADLYLRRGQLKLKGQVMPSLMFQTVFAYDNIGKDPYGGTSYGSGQDLNCSRLILQEAMMDYTLDPNLAVFTLGYFRPQTSREFTGSFSAVSSLDYALTYGYVRQHLGTRSAGRETGADIGGQWSMPGLGGINWHLGGFDAIQEKAKSYTSTDLRGHHVWSPLWTGRLAITAGDMENPKQAMKSSVQAFGKRTGLTIGVYGSYQGYTDQLWDTTTKTSNGVTTTKITYAGGFNENSMLGYDLLGNWKGLALNGEIAWLHREGKPHPDSSKVSYTDQVWHVRTAYAYKLGDSLGFLEPSFTYSRFKGSDKSLQNPGGEETQLDIGLNYYPAVKGMRIAVHYVRPDGEAKSQYTSGLSNGIQNFKNTTIVGEILFSL
ncbi:MAG TPA: hypothetical protein VLM37_09730 [Fibrobacteraceae bacterium]|nr:hypothetical protein [Fibrobacteraceae bacterium]